MKLQFAKDLPFKIKSTLFDFVINSFVGKEEVVAPVVFEQQMLSQMANNAPMRGCKMRRRSSENLSEASYLASVCEFPGQGQQMPQRNRNLKRKTSEAFNRSES